MKSASMEKKQKKQFKRNSDDQPGAKNVNAKLQQVNEIVTNTIPNASTEKLSPSTDHFSPKKRKNHMKSARPLSADFQQNSLSPEILTSKSELYISKHDTSNKSPIPTLEPLIEENETKHEKKKRKAATSPNAGNHSPNRLATGVAAIMDSKRHKKHGSPTKIDSEKNTGKIKSCLKDSNVVPFSEVIRTRFPLLKDDELVKRFQNVAMTNNQKGRIRQTLKGIFQGSNTSLLPDIIYNKIQHILQSKETLTDADLRKVRVLYNMLRVATEIEMKNAGKQSLSSSFKKDSDFSKDVSSLEIQPVHTKKVQTSNRRYVVFVGNLPLDVDKEKLMGHFEEFKVYVKDVRIPKPKEGQNSAIAYLELSTEPAFEMALSKHHTMFCNKRINVLYSKQQNSKMSKGEAKAKAAKMVALVKSGQLIGSLPLNKKRSHRRAIMRQAQKKENNDV